MMKNNKDANMIPMTDEMRGLQGAVVDAMCEPITVGRMDDEAAGKITETLKALIDCVLRSMPEIEHRGIVEVGISLATQAVVEAMDFALEEIGKNKTLHANRQVLVNAIRGDLMNDNRAFIVMNKASWLVQDITPYTSDPKVIAAYKKVFARLTDEKYVVKRLTKRRRMKDE